jgi:predicted RNA binding protein YcfA (HicA-like mRNA interferase family)
MKRTGSIQDRIDTLFRESRMQLKRSGKHLVWKHPDGRSFTMSSTPSDGNARRQTLRSLERFLGLRAKADKGAHT